MQVGFVNNQVSIVDGGWLSQDQALKLQQAILKEGTADFICQRSADYLVFYTLTEYTERYCFFSFDSANNLLMESY